MKLDVGSGVKPMIGPDWEDMDIRESIAMFDHTYRQPKIVGDVRNGIPRDDEFYEEVRMHSLLEHFGKRDKDKVLKECYRVLKTGGKLWISVPDLILIAKELIEMYNSEVKVYELINLLYGEQDYKENTHLWGYTEKSLSKDLMTAGFVKVTRLPAERYKYELVVEAIK